MKPPLKRDAIKKANTKQFTRSLRFSVALLSWFALLHLAGIYLFTRGFLLTRLVLDNRSNCSDFAVAGCGSTGCWHPQSFGKAVIIVIDALRFDFTVPVEKTPLLCHNVFDIPYRTTTEQPEHSVLLRFIADPPTTTLQRLKGLTTGTLPTFIDAGSNFAGTEIQEDNIMSQLASAGKRIAFMGDDTWTSLFPECLDPNMTWPFESFNVPDLHTVDRGVESHMYDLLSSSHEWDVLVAHFLGVDHVGHQFGPDHKEMAGKLMQMNEDIKKVLDLLDNDTVLFVFGDHGMDPKGDHGGDSQGEVEAALWMYSKKAHFGKLPHSPPVGRAVSQIDFVPTISLLLGVPVPFNNLGAPIAEAFLGHREDRWQNLAHASAVSSQQLKRYQEDYAAFAQDQSDLEADAYYRNGLSIMDSASEADDFQRAHESFVKYQERTVDIYRSLWAHFDLLSILLGIAIVAVSAILMALHGLCIRDDKTEVSEVFCYYVFLTAACGATIGFFMFKLLSLHFSAVNGLIIGASFTSISGYIKLLVAMRHRLNLRFSSNVWSGITLTFTFTHAALFASNSFTIWEDRYLTFIMVTFGMIATLLSLRLPSAQEQSLAAYHSVLFVILCRAASWPRLCREEQMPYCQSTFYATSSSSVSAPWTLLLLFGTAFTVPAVVKSYYRVSRSYEGPAALWIGVGLRVGLLLNALYWTLDGVGNAGWLDISADAIVKSKHLIARIVLGGSLIAGNIGWSKGAYCIKVDSQKRDTASGKSSVVIYGYANAFGSSYFLFVLNFFLALSLIQKPLGAVAFDILIFQILSLLEIIDYHGVSMNSVGPVVLGMLGASHFFSTGHQATLSSIQWESAFIPMSRIIYPFTPLLLIANTFGSQILIALSVPLLVLWKRSPKSQHILSDTFTATISFLLYHTVVALTSMAFAAWFRRHLMVWKIFAPRYMMGAIVLLLMDIGTIFIAFGFGAGTTIHYIGNLLGFSESVYI